MASEYNESQFSQSYQFLWNWQSVVTYLVEISDFLTFISNPICFKFTHVENLIYFCENRMIFHTERIRPNELYVAFMF